MTYMLARVLAIVAILWIGLIVYRRWMGDAAKPAGRRQGQKKFQPMSPCAVCGVHLPVSELSADGRCKSCIS